MQARLDGVLGPLVVFLPKSVRHPCLIRTVGDADGRFDECPVLEELDVVAHPVRVEQLEPVIDLVTVFIHEPLQGGHRVDGRVEAFPQVSLIHEGHAKFTDVAGEFLLLFSVFLVREWIQPKRPGILPGDGFDGNDISACKTISHIDLCEVWTVCGGKIPQHEQGAAGEPAPVRAVRFGILGLDVGRACQHDDKPHENVVLLHV